MGSLGRSQSVIFISHFVKREFSTKLWITYFDSQPVLLYYNSMNVQTVFLSKITKIGNSHGITIPQNILSAYNWQRGDIVMFGFAGGDQLYVKRISDKELEQLKPKGPLAF